MLYFCLVKHPKVIRSQGNNFILKEINLDPIKSFLCTAQTCPIKLKITHCKLQIWGWTASQSLISPCNSFPGTSGIPLHLAGLTFVTFGCSWSPLVPLPCQGLSDGCALFPWAGSVVPIDCSEAASVATIAASAVLASAVLALVASLAMPVALSSLSNSWVAPSGEKDCNWMFWFQSRVEDSINWWLHLALLVGTKCVCYNSLAKECAADLLTISLLHVISISHTMNWQGGWGICCSLCQIFSW